MARKRSKGWSYIAGRYGARVRIYEPRKGTPLRWDYRDADGVRRRPEVHPTMVVRAEPKGAVDPVLAKRAEALCERKYAELTLAPESPQAPVVFTVARAYQLFFDPRKKALPESRSARTHHTASREFWTKEFGAGTPWDEVRPADVTAALLRLKEFGQVATAEKRLANLRTLYRWLTEEMDMEIRDPTRGHRKLKKRITAGYEPRKPRLSPEQMRSLRKALPQFSWRTRLFFTLLMPSGTRAVQARNAMRAGLDAKLQPPPPKKVAPHGWFLFMGVKNQPPHLTFLTEAQRLELDAALAGPLAAYEARYQAGEMADYPLIPGGRIDRAEQQPVPISDTGLRKELTEIFAAAKIPPAERLGFHAVRRGWADIINDRAGLSVTKNAGGWQNEKTTEGYLSRYQHGDIERARQVMEDEERD